MYCRECGSELPQGAHFCPQCGHVAGEEAKSDAGATSAAPPKKKMALWKKIAIGLVAIIVAVVGLALFATSGLREPVDRQLAALGRGDFQAAYSETSQAFQRSTSLAQFEQFIRANPIIAEANDASFSERRVEDGVGYLQGRLTTPSGGVQPISYRLVKEEGVWKVLSIDLNPGQ